MIFGRLKSALERKRPAAQSLRVEPAGIEINLEPGRTLLESLLAEGVAWPHNCTVGTCGSCRSLLKAGRVKPMSEFGYTLSDAELRAGYILVCQSAAVDESLVIERPDPQGERPQPADFSARVTSFRKLSPEIGEMTLELDRPIEFVAGQYLNVSEADGLAPRHYSFAMPPRRGGTNVVRFFARLVKGGRFTDALFNGRLEGSTLAANGPHGDFHLMRGDGPMVCIAGGSGLAPILSMLEDAFYCRTRRRVLLLFGMRTAQDLYAADRLDDLAKNWPERFDLVRVLSHEPQASAWTGRRGFVTEAIGAADLDFPWADAQAYLCGPPPMVDSSLERLTALGVSLDAIRYDRFTDESHR